MYDEIYEDNIVADKILDDSRRLNISSGNILCTIVEIYYTHIIHDTGNLVFQEKLVWPRQTVLFEREENISIKSRI